MNKSIIRKLKIWDFSTKLVVKKKIIETLYINDKEKYSTEIVAETMQMLGGRAPGSTDGGMSNGSSMPESRSTAPMNGPTLGDIDDDIPF